MVPESDVSGAASSFVALTAPFDVGRSLVEVDDFSDRNPVARMMLPSRLDKINVATTPGRRERCSREVAIEGGKVPSYGYTIVSEVFMKPSIFGIEWAQPLQHDLTIESHIPLGLEPCRRHNNWSNGRLGSDVLTSHY